MFLLQQGKARDSEEELRRDGEEKSPSVSPFFFLYFVGFSFFSSPCLFLSLSLLKVVATEAPTTTTGEETDRQSDTWVDK